jgi:hypothetical protein
MASSQLRSIARRFSWSKSSRRVSASSWDSTHSYDSNESSTSATASVINTIIARVPSIADLEEERRVFSSELSVLEPRPIVYWEGMEGKMGTLN